MHISRSEKLKSGKRPTRNDVASVANISGATVWRVLSGRNDVSISPETRAKVLEAAAKIGYQPNTAARALMKGKSGLVGFWMSLAYSRYRSQVLHRMRSILGQTIHALAITDVDAEYHWDHTFDRALRVPVDGIIAFDTSASGETFAQNHARLAPHTPYVSMGAYWSESKSYVGVDLAAGARMAMDHLIGTGRRKIAYLAPFQSGLLEEGDRFEAYREKMCEAGFCPHVIGTVEERPPAIQVILEGQFKAGGVPDALLCMNDDLAIVTAMALQRMGLNVGPDVAVVGFDGLWETEYAAVPITTVSQPVDEMCTLSWQFLEAQMLNPEAALQQRILLPELVIRESSRVSQ